MTSMPSTDLRLGFIALARPTFDMSLAAQMEQELRAQLATAGVSLCGPEGLVCDVSEARSAAGALAADPPDLLLVLQATFADSAMALEVARMVDAPLLLWAVPEPAGGGRLRLNSLCGINLAAHGLKRAGQRYDWVYAPPGDPAALQRVRDLALAGYARRCLQRARIGRLGEQPAGFEPCGYDAAALEGRLGVKVVPFALERVFQAVRGVPPAAIDTAWQEVASRLDGLHGLDRTAVRGTLAAWVALRRLAGQERLDGLAVRCWPEFFTDLGCAACGALSMLSNALIPCSCEADVNGTITQFILQCLSGEPAFGSDLVTVDADAGTGVLWHCGLAPLAMADPAARPRATVHPNRKLPVLMEFSLRPSRITLARLSEAAGSYRLVVASGEMLQRPPSFSGTSGVLRFDRPAGEVLETILGEGLEHHFSLTYGDHTAALLALARMLELPVLRL